MTHATHLNVILIKITPMYLGSRLFIRLDQTFDQTLHLARDSNLGGKNERQIWEDHAACQWPGTRDVPLSMPGGGGECAICGRGTEFPRA